METVQWPAGLKRTRQRDLAWHILLAAGQPLDAAALHQRMVAESGPLAMSTVYRVLAAFVSCGLVEKTIIMGSETALYTPRRGHAHYAICLKCRRQFPLCRCPLEALRETPEGFTVTGHRLELYGYCQDCLKKQEMSSGNTPQGR